MCAFYLCELSVNELAYTIDNQMGGKEMYSRYLLFMCFLYLSPQVKRTEQNKLQNLKKTLFLSVVFFSCNST